MAVLGAMPALGYEFFAQLRTALGGSMKVLHTMTADSPAAVCSQEGCVVNPEADVCAVDPLQLSTTELAALLVEATCILHFTQLRPLFEEAALVEAVMRAAYANPQFRPTYIFALQNASGSGSAFEASLVHHVLHGTESRRPSSSHVHAVRLHHVYGVQDPQLSPSHLGLIPRLLHQALTGKELRPPADVPRVLYPAYIADAVAALRAVTQFDRNYPRPVDIASGEVTTVDGLLAAVADLASRCLHKTVTIPGPAKASWLAEGSVTPFDHPKPDLMKWKPEHPLQRGLALSMLQTIKLLSKRQRLPGDVDERSATQCLESLGQGPTRIPAYFTLAAQLRHPILCSGPAWQPLPEAANKTLIVMIGGMRSQRLTWHTFEEYVLNPKYLGGPVDLALAMSPGQDSPAEQRANLFYAKAKYVWEMHNPPKNNYRIYFSEIARACFNRSFTAEDARKLGQRFPGNFLGRIAEAGHTDGSSTLHFFRWVILQQLWYLRLLDQYQYLVTARTDMLWTAPHPCITGLQPKNVLIPSGSDWGGVNDRHTVLHAADAADILTICYRFLDRPADEAIASLLKDGFRSGSWDIWNGEAWLRFWLALQNITVRRFPSVSYIVWDRQQPGQTGDFYRGIKVRPASPVLVVPKYTEEYDLAMQNQKLPRDAT